MSARAFLIVIYCMVAVGSCTGYTVTFDEMRDRGELIEPKWGDTAVSMIVGALWPISFGYQTARREKMIPYARPTASPAPETDQ